MLGSLASLLGMFLGALVSGLIGALALNLIDRLISKKLKQINEGQQISKRNEILATQAKLIDVVKVNTESTRCTSLNNIQERHKNASEAIRSSIEQIMANEKQINTPIAENAVIVDDEPEKSENEDNLIFYI